MHSPNIVHVAIGMAALSAVLSAFALLPSPQRVAALAEPLPAATAQEVQAVRAELTRLRAELEALRQSLRGSNQRRALRPAEDEPDEDENEQEVEESLVAPTDDLSSAHQALPQAFSLRESLLENFHSLSGADRADALRALAELARWGDAEAHALLLMGMEDQDARVRGRAVRELTELADPALQERLPVLAADRSGDVREAAARALGRLPSESTGPLLVDLLGDRKDDVVLEALRSLDRLDYEEAGPRVRSLLAAPDLDVAARAATFLRERGDKGATASVVGRVLEHFARSDVSARVNDVKCLRTLRARTELLNILETDASPSVRYEAQKALASLER